MSFEVFLQSYSDGMPSGIDRRAMMAVFGSYLIEKSTSLWRVDYGDGDYCDIYVDKDPEEIAGMMVSRPIADGRLWDALFAVMKLGNFVLYWPGGKTPLVANVSIIPHLPKDMVASLGTPLCIFRGQDILDGIKSS